MSENMLPFRRIEISDRPWVMERLKKSDFMGCEYTFGNNFIWRNSHNIQVLDFKGFCFLKSKYAYTYPAGDGDIKEAIEALILDAQLRKTPFVLRGVTVENLEILNDIFPNYFDYEDARDESDYVYLSEKLSTLSGKKLQSKRNHISRFKDNPNWIYEPINEDNITDCYEFGLDWYKANVSNKNDNLQKEYSAVLQAFRSFSDLKFDGGLIRREGKVVAFSMGEPLNSDTYVIHIEKADPNIQGAYPMINQQFVINNCREFKYINREDDAGDIGLRKAKLSYGPEIMLTKYRLKLKELFIYDITSNQRDGQGTYGDLEEVLR